MNFFRNASAIGVVLLATSAHSATITQMGTDISFTYDDATLFGVGTVSGNNIFFTPDAFLAQSIDGAGVATSVDTLDIHVVTTTAGFNLTSFLLIENGDYKLEGAGANVDADTVFQVVSNTNLTGCSGILCQDAFSTSAGALTDTGGASVTWSLGGGIDLADTVGWGSDTDVNISLENTLLADTTTMGEIAFIQKKFGAIGITINPVPVPAAVWLFGSGLLGLIGIARRR